MTSPTPQANRFRFRAWQDILKEMRYFDLFELQAIDSLLDYKAINNGTLPIMQSTGLLDRNGKEIFEGDIISIKSHFVPSDDSIGFIQWFHNFCEFQLETVGENIYSIHDWSGGDTEHSITENNMEVIGNIYATPHLLPKP